LERLEASAGPLKRPINKNILGRHIDVVGVLGGRRGNRVKGGIRQRQSALLNRILGAALDDATIKNREFLNIRRHSILYTNKKNTLT
jgi:hypothetical protein